MATQKLRVDEALDACYDETEKHTLQQKMNEKMLRYNMMMEKQLHKPTYQKYQIGRAHV